MPPVAFSGDLKEWVQNTINCHKVMVFSKTTCPFCAKVKELLQSLKVEYYALELDQISNGSDVQQQLLELSGQRTVPNVFINGKHLGGCDATIQANTEGRLLKMINGEEEEYDYDLVVIGGGSGGLACSKAAADLGKRVAVLDFVKPSPQGTTWGLGGTCVNVGCIPKKLMHQAALLGHSLEDAKNYGWQLQEETAKHNWEKMKDSVQDHIGSLNWGYRVQLRDKTVQYLNAYGTFVDQHKIKATNKRGKVTEVTSANFVIATGGRPRIPDIPGAKEFGISSDDLFSLPYCPGKTLVIGASYVALECAGFLAGLGLDVTLMVRSILLRGFDQQMAEKIGDYMENHGVKFLRQYVPLKVERLQEGTPGLLKVTAKPTSGAESDSITGEYNTVLFAVGRDACTENIGLDNIGVRYNTKNGKLFATNEQTNISNVYAIGDVLDEKPELTPVAIQAGKLLAERLFNGSTKQVDYTNVATTVFTPLEYGCIGLAEEDAIAQFGQDNLEVYHTNFQPLEYTVAHREENVCYGKLICLKTDNQRVIGFHVLGPNAGEITQGYALAMKLGATKDDFDNTIGIHPTCSEVFTTLSVTKSSGGDVKAAGC
ncbi:unnamed protein product [Owenia fusiformis]|uniref:thioredoxin-disulfide reductase (NADPH) n=1 Tax=Owenia fusiformis TaxID=6347 RepID=A0A8J1XHS2_OWEFU|nr:unnamed protein product [Owenia fusiformis]